MADTAIQFELLPYPERWPTLEAEWLQLFERSPRVCVFYHPLFLAAAQALPRDEQPTHLVVGRRDGELAFGLPVSVGRSPLGVGRLTLFGGRGFDHLMPLDSTSGWTASSEFLTGLQQRWGWPVLDGNAVDQEFADLVASVAGERRWAYFRRDAYRCPYLELPESEEELLASLSRKFRFNLRRALRQAEEDAIQFRVVTADGDGYTLGQALANLFGLHEERADEVDRESRFVGEGSRVFHQRICDEARRFDGVVHFVEAVRHDKVIGSLYGFLAADRFSFWQSGFASDFGRYSPGSLLILRTMAFLIERKVRLFDFLRGADSYKFRWTESFVNDCLVLTAASTMGRIALDAHRWQRAMRRRGRWVGTLEWLRRQD